MSTTKRPARHVVTGRRLTHDERHAPLTEGVAPLRTRPVVHLRWDAILTALAALILGVAIGIGIGYQLAPGIPPCTDEIANAGGICQGPLQ